MINNIRWFFRRLKRVWEFLPYVWKGYDFDYGTAINLFKYQLSRTEKFMSSDGTFTVDADVRARRIKTAVELLQKVYDEDYAMEYYDQMTELYGPNVMDYWFEDTGSDDGSSFLKYEYEKWDNHEEVEQTKTRLFKLSQDKQKRAEKLVWEFISHNIRGWWD
tara:strand:- start:730 stop:1215 length:486 start_codon:yes stop_codon:yes gene_type:complete